MNSLQYEQINSQPLPLIYRIYSTIHHALSFFEPFTVLGKHPSIITRNHLNRFMFSYLLTKEKQYVSKTKHGFFIKVPLNDQAAAEIIFERRYSHQQTEVLIRLMDYCSAFLDIGANLGYFSLLVLSIRNNFPVVVIEPNGKLCSLINESMKVNNFHGGKVIRAGAGKHKGQGYLNVDENRSSNAQVIQMDSRDEREKLEILTVDDVLKNEAQAKWLVKIDVEGAEIDVLSGSKYALERQSIFMLEVTQKRVDNLGEFLTNYDYTSLDLSGEIIKIEQLRKHMTNDILLVPSGAVKSIADLLKK